jgi:uncharacterized protein (AIM24 family)
MNGVSSAFNRLLTGQNMFLTDFYYDPNTITSSSSLSSSSSYGTVCLGTDFPSKILRFNINEFPNQTLICQRSAYLASNTTINIETEFTKTLTSGFFGGQGFILQKLTGIGEVLIKGGGTIKTLSLQEHETLRVTSGSIVAFESTISYDVQMMSGIKNIMFSGEGLFVTTLKGPGQVWLQGMPPDRMIAEIARRIPAGSSGIGFGIPIGIGGGGGDVGTSDGSTTVDASPSAPGIGEEIGMMSSSDAAIQADRNTTVASSGMSSSTHHDDVVAASADSPTALFGDAVPQSTAPHMNPIPTSSNNSDQGGMSSNVTENGSTDYEDDTIFSSSTTETSMNDTSSFGDDNNAFDSNGTMNENDNEMNDGELFNDNDDDDDDSSSTISDDSSSSSSGDSILNKIWDFFTGRDE